MKKTLPDLSGFHGTEHFYKHWLGGIIYTDGILCIAKECGAVWLIDLIASAQTVKKVKKEEYQIWTLTVKDDKATITCKGDTNWPVVYQQEIEYADFPEGVLKLTFENNTLCLPSER